MDKKILSLVVCILICFIIIIGLFILKLGAIAEKQVTEETILKESVIDDPVEGEYKVHRSENGYVVKYPSNMEGKQMAKAIDFILDDEVGSSLNIVTAKNDGSLKKMTREEFEYSFKAGSMDGAVLHSYNEVDLNGNVATVANFTYNGNDVTQTIIINNNYGYNITVTKSPNISDEMSEIFDNVVKSFTLN